MRDNEGIMVQWKQLKTELSMRKKENRYLILRRKENRRPFAIA